MAPGTPNVGAAKPTFAKVAASSYKVKEGNKSTQSTENATQPPQSLEQKPKIHQILKSQPGKGSDDTTNIQASQQKVILPQREGKDRSLMDDAAARITFGMNGHPSKPASNDDGSTNLSSDGSGKQPSFDTKSIASGTTFALDEKESLRPDDSASIRAAIEEEDMFSAPGSVVTGSRVGSDLGTKAFREQLQEIPYLGSIPLRPGMAPQYQVALPLVNQSIASRPALPIETIAEAASDGHEDALVSSLVPDEKLMDALQSQRDRVWVLKLEQDIIDFVGQSKEATLTLPQCNAFYRMLAHKLADYYRLEHAVSQSATGSAVVITRTPFCRIPPPLSGLPNLSAVSETPPLILPARKIMRRPGDPKSSENTTAANSEGPSASVSEVGVDNLASEQQLYGIGKTKAQLTREEREKQYAQARERIFGKGEALEETENTVVTDEPDPSRSSSTSGKKKQTKKQRNLSNDDFEPRSQFPVYYNGTYPSGYTQEQYYYSSYPVPMPAGQVYPLTSPPTIPATMGFQQAYPQPDASSYAWNGQHAIPMTTTPGGVYHQIPASGYDLSLHFQNAMQFPHGMPTVGKGATSPLPGYPAQPMSVTAAPSQWSQALDPNNPYARQIYAQPGYQDRGMAVPGVLPQNGPYGYSSYPSQAYAQATTPKVSAQLPHMVNNYHRASFNPQSQSFIPSGPGNGPPTISSPIGASYPQYPIPPQAQYPRPVHPTIAPIPTQSASNDTHTKSMQQHPSKTKATIEPNHLASSSANNEDASASGSKQELEITAKFGTPSHLPPRPPPPQTMEPHKYIEINRGIGGIHTYPGLPRIAADGLTGTNNTSREGTWN